MVGIEKVPKLITSTRAWQEDSHMILFLSKIKVYLLFWLKSDNLGSVVTKSPDLVLVNQNIMFLTILIFICFVQFTSGGGG